MAGHRQDKLNNAVCLELAAILREVKDPRVSGAFISIVGANVAPDMSVAQIFYSVLGSDEGVQKGLVSATGFIRSSLAKRLNLRITPKLTFIRDNKTERAMHISQILKDIEG